MCCFLLSGVVFAHNGLWLHDSDAYARFKAGLNFKSLDLGGFHVFPPFWSWCLRLTDYTECGLAAIIFKTDEFTRFKTSLDFEDLNLYGFHLGCFLLSGIYL